MHRRIIFNDLKNGLWRRIFLFLPIPLFVFFVAFSHMKQTADYGSQGSFLSAVLAVMEGIKVIEDPSEFAFISPFFILLYSWLILITAYYAYDDMKEYGIQTFTRCGQKYSWWISKCIWNFCTVMLYYGLIYLTCFLVAVIWGNPSFTVDETVWNFLFMAEKEMASGRTFFLYVFVLPVFTALALSMAQMFLSITFSPIAGAAANILVLLVSISCLSQWLPGNYLMFLRMFLRIDEGVKFLPAFFVDIGLLIGSAWGGVVILKKKDIF